MKTTKRRKEPTAEQKAAAQVKRAELIALSRRLKKAMEAGAFPDAEKLNDAIVTTYQQQTGQTDFRAFAGWREEGFQVRKGEHGFPIWGKPRRATAGEAEPAPEGGGDDPAKTFRLFPIAHLFHAGQVEPIDPSQPRRERQERTPRPTPAPREDAPTPGRDAALAAKLHALAEGMAAEIDSKRNPSIGNQNPTPRRHRIAEGMRREGEQLALAQTVLYARAASLSGQKVQWFGELDAPSIQIVTTKAGAIDYARRNEKALRDAMARAGHAPTVPDWKARHRAALGNLIGCKYDGFFPTGEGLAARVAEMAELTTETGLQILEPSAGTGSLVLAAVERIGAGSKIWTVERVPRLSAVLDILAEGHAGTIQNLGAGDFLAYEDGEFPEGPADFDRIIMNPPFEKGQDMQHVLAAYSLLKPGGILVAIVCANVQYREDGDFPAFRDWLEEVHAETEKAPENAFQGTIRSTNVAALVLKIRK